jgi:alpha-galactosidase/6-phospho-beta-glucosidase family protein
MMQLQDADFVITHLEGYELNPEITKDSKIEYDQNKAFENADFIYTKTGAVTKITVKSLITILNGLQIK